MLVSKLSSIDFLWHIRYTPTSLADLISQL